MAIRYLIYACLECGREDGLKAAENSEVCDRCQTRYTRVDQARIKIEPPNQEPVIRTAAECLDLLNATGIAREIGRSVRVILRIAERQRPYRHAGIYLGQVERFGDPVEGELTVDSEAIRFVGGGISHQWLLGDLTAVQPSSTSLQLKVRHGPVLSLKFPESSPLLWEERIRHTVQALYLTTGRGEILEYQPRIVCR